LNAFYVAIQMFLQFILIFLYLLKIIFKGRN
jgi:FtsH-binding integral membrane protein